VNANEVSYLLSLLWLSSIFGSVWFGSVGSAWIGRSALFCLFAECINEIVHHKRQRHATRFRGATVIAPHKREKHATRFSDATVIAHFSSGPVWFVHPVFCFFTIYVHSQITFLSLDTDKIQVWQGGGIR
jgi:hypothetical protein